MNYQKIYDSLCARGQSNRILDCYSEVHHIIPKCLGGSNEKENLTRLTYREHFIAHWLLCKLHKTESSVHYAFLCMLRKQPTGERILNSRMFSTIKKNFSEFKKWHSKIVNPGRSKASREAARNRMLTRNPTRMSPEKNRTAQPIKVYWSNGNITQYEYAKQLTITNGVPYGTVKHMLTHNSSSKKWGIIKIERIEKEK